MTLNHLSPIAVAALLTSATPVAAQTPFLTTPNLSAFVDGPSCGTAVRFRFIGTRRDVFAETNPTPGRMMNSVAQLVRSQCPTVRRVVTTGMVGDLIVYSGFAEATTGWKVRELGAGGALMGDASGEGASGQREMFLRGGGVLTPVELATTARSSPVICQRRDAANTCAGALTMSGLTAEGGTVVGRYLVDKDGTTAVGTYRAAFRGNLLCTDPATARWTVTGGAVSAEMRGDMADNFASRMRAAGNPLCLGFARRGRATVSESFGGNGRRITAASEVTFTATEPRLRFDR